MNCLVVIDMQKGFMDEGTEHIKVKLKDFLTKNLNLFDYVVATRYVNNEESACFKFEGWDGCMPGSGEEELIDELSDINFYKVFDKSTYSCYNNEFKDFIKSNMIDKLYYAGVNTECCVLHSAFDSYNDLIDSSVIEDLCGTTTGEESHKSAIHILEKCITRERVIKSTDLITGLSEQVSFYQTNLFNTLEEDNNCVSFISEKVSNHAINYSSKKYSTRLEQMTESDSIFEPLLNRYDCIIRYIIKRLDVSGWRIYPLKDNRFKLRQAISSFNNLMRSNVSDEVKEIYQFDDWKKVLEYLGSHDVKVYTKLNGKFAESGVNTVRLVEKNDSGEFRYLHYPINKSFDDICGISELFDSVEEDLAEESYKRIAYWNHTKSNQYSSHYESYRLRALRALSNLSKRGVSLSNIISTLKNDDISCTSSEDEYIGTPITSREDGYVGIPITSRGYNLKRDLKEGIIRDSSDLRSFCSRYNNVLDIDIFDIAVYIHLRLCNISSLKYDDTLDKKMSRKSFYRDNRSYYTMCPSLFDDFDQYEEEIFGREYVLSNKELRQASLNSSDGGFEGGGKI